MQARGTAMTKINTNLHDVCSHALEHSCSLGEISTSLIAIRDMIDLRQETAAHTDVWCDQVTALLNVMADSLNHISQDLESICLKNLTKEAVS